MLRLVYLLIVLTVVGCAGIGDPPDEDQMKNFSQSKNFDQKGETIYQSSPKRDRSST